MSTFYEPDEPRHAVVDAFNRGEKGTTGPAKLRVCDGEDHGVCCPGDVYLELPNGKAVHRDDETAYLAWVEVDPELIAQWRAQSQGRPGPL